MATLRFGYVAVTSDADDSRSTGVQSDDAGYHDILAIVEHRLQRRAEPAQLDGHGPSAAVAGRNRYGFDEPLAVAICIEVADESDSAPERHGGSRSRAGHDLDARR